MKTPSACTCPKSLNDVPYIKETWPHEKGCPLFRGEKKDQKFTRDSITAFKNRRGKEETPTPVQGIDKKIDTLLVGLVFDSFGAERRRRKSSNAGDRIDKLVNELVTPLRKEIITLLTSEVRKESGRSEEKTVNYFILSRRLMGTDEFLDWFDKHYTNKALEEEA